MSLYHHSMIFTTCVYLFRCEAFNRIIRNYNVHGNRQASSRDIAVKFSSIEHLRYLSDGGLVSGSRYMYTGLAKTIIQFFLSFVRCGEGLCHLFHTDVVQNFVHGTSMREIHGDKSIYQPGTLRKVIHFRVNSTSSNELLS